MITAQFNFPDAPTAIAALPGFLLVDGVTFDPARTAAVTDGTPGYPIIVSVDVIGAMAAIPGFFGACQKQADGTYTILAGTMPGQVFE